MFKRRTIVSVPYARRRRQKIVIRLTLIAVAVLVLFGTLIYILWRPALRIQTITVSGHTFSDTETIATTAQKIVSGKYWYLFPRDSFLLIPRPAIRAALFVQHTELRDIDIDVDGPTRMSIEVMEHEPYSQWCSTVTVNDDLIRSADCYSMTQTGYIFVHTVPTELPSPIRWYGLIETDSPLGQTFVVTPTLTEWQDFSELLANTVSPLTYIIAKGNSEYEAVFENGGKLFLNDKQSLERSFSSLRTVLSERAKTASTSASAFEYVDLRFGSKVYVK